MKRRARRLIRFLTRWAVIVSAVLGAGAQVATAAMREDGWEAQNAKDQNDAYQNEFIIPKDELMPLATDMQIYRSSGGAIVGGIVGGIIGVVVASQWDSGDGPRRGKIATCFAQNRRGDTFRSSDRSASHAQDVATAKCQSSGSPCRVMGCR